MQNNKLGGLNRLGLELEKRILIKSNFNQIFFNPNWSSDFTSSVRRNHFNPIGSEFNQNIQIPSKIGRIHVIKNKSEVIENYQKIQLICHFQLILSFPIL